MTLLHPKPRGLMEMELSCRAEQSTTAIMLASHLDDDSFLGDKVAVGMECVESYQNQQVVRQFAGTMM